MKSCPTCNRTFEDSFTFCLVDGAILSAPGDPQTTQRIPEVRKTDPPPTESLSHKNSLYHADLPPTIQASPQTSKDSSPERKTSPSFVKRLLRGAIVGLAVGVVIGPIVIVVNERPSAWPVGLFFGSVYGLILGATINSIGRLLIGYIGKIWRD
jgi:hypothetical protein